MSPSGPLRSRYLDDDWPPDLPTEPPPDLEVVTARVDPLTVRMTAGGSFVLDAPEHIPAVWGSGTSVGWAEGESLLLCGPPGVGKTTIATQLVKARLKGGEVLAMPVQPTSKRVLYLAMDRPQQIARAHRRLYAEGDRRLLDERLVFWPGPPPYDLAKRPDTLVEMAAEAQADTVIVDSLKDAAIGLTDDEVGAGYNRARQRALVEGVQLLELHHQRKAMAGNRPNALDDVYGSVWLTAGAGSVLLVWGSPGDAIVELLHLKQPAESLGPLRVIHNHVAGTSAVYHPTDLLTLAVANRGNLTAKLAAVALFETDKPDRNQVERARRKLDAMVRDGLLFITGEGARGGTPGDGAATYGASVRGAS